jgi:hypothetical protein
MTALQGETFARDLTLQTRRAASRIRHTAIALPPGTEETVLPLSRQALRRTFLALAGGGAFGFFFRPVLRRSTKSLSGSRSSGFGV